MAIRSALFVDYDNAVSLHRGQGLSNRLGNWLSWFEDGCFDPKGRKRKFLVKCAYWHPRYEEAAPAFQHAGFLTRSCIYAAGSKENQSAVDIHLVVDAIDAVSRIKNIQEVVVLATDSDYFPLIATLRARNIATAIIVSPRDASKIFEAEADIAIPAAALADAYAYVRPRRTGFASLLPSPAGARPSPQAPPVIVQSPPAPPQNVSPIPPRAAPSEVAPPRPAPPPAAAPSAASEPSEDIALAALAEAFAAFVSSRKGPVRAAEAMKKLRDLSPNMKTSGANAFHGKSSLVGLLSEIASLTGKIKVFWMGPGQPAVRSTARASRAA